VIYVVCGFHRSGTSVVANILHDSGVFMGDGFALPAKENPRGFWEDLSFKRINERVLSDCGYGDVKKWSDEMPGVKWTKNTKQKAVAAIKKRSKDHEQWGWKDPRTMLTLDLWCQVIKECSEDVTIIWVDRNPSETVYSLRVRQGGLDKKKAMRAYVMYMAKFWRDLYTSKVPFVKVNYIDVIKRKSALDGLLSVVKYDCVDDNLCRNGAS